MNDFIVLFTDTFSRKTFDLFNIVKNRFSQAELLVSFEGHSWDVLRLKLIYQKSTFEKLSTLNYSRFEQTLNSIVSKLSNQKIVFLPIEEKTILLFYEYIKNNGVRNFLFSLPNESIFSQVRDKSSLMNFCVLNNFPHPKTYENLDKLDGLKGEHRLLSKPSVGEGSKGILRFKRMDAIERFFQDRVVQDEVKHSEGVIGVFLNCKGGQISGQYCHQRLRTFPLNGGVTVLSEVVESNRCLEISKEIVSKLKWDGLIMLEFLYDQNSKEFLLLEINPRLWGSLLLSEEKFQGLITLYISELIGVECKVEIPQLGYRIRWVWPYDLIYLMTGKITFKDFVSNDKTLFINWTYAPKISALIFMFFSILDIAKWKNLIKKI